MGCGNSKNVVVGKYDNYDWDELPTDAQAAAETLGYDRALWDRDGTVPAEDKEWNELTAEEQQAANVLGYDQAKWEAGYDTNL